MPDRPAPRLILAACLVIACHATAAIAAESIAADRPNLAGLVKATASSEQPGNVVAAAIDGDQDSRWCAANGSAPQWWRADFEEPQRVVAVELDWEFPGRDYRYVVETSRDGTTWTKAADAEQGGQEPRRARGPGRSRRRCAGSAGDVSRRPRLGEHPRDPPRGATWHQGAEPRGRSPRQGHGGTCQRGQAAARLHRHGLRHAGRGLLSRVRGRDGRRHALRVERRQRLARPRPEPQFGSSASATPTATALPTRSRHTSATSTRPASSCSWTIGSSCCIRRT